MCVFNFVNYILYSVDQVYISALLGIGYAVGPRAGGNLELVCSTDTMYPGNLNIYTRIIRRGS